MREALPNAFLMMIASNGWRNERIGNCRSGAIVLLSPRGASNGPVRGVGSLDTGLGQGLIKADNMIAFTVLSELPPRAAYRLRERLLLE